MTKQEIIRFLQSRSNSGSALGLSRVELLLDYVKHPEQDLKFVHVAGTNGKGSVVAFLSSILENAGYKVGRFQSPAVFSYEEQIRIGETPISDYDFEETAEEIINAVKQMEQDGHESPTEFEILVPLAMVYFKKKNCDIVLFEVGLGGEGDATNVIPTPLLALITKISYDHMNYLGPTLTSIASAKAGIIKKDGTVIIAEQSEEARKVFDEKTKKMHASLTELSFDSPLRKEADLFVRDIDLGLKGNYQKENAALAYAAAKELTIQGFPISKEQMEEGLKEATWPGRFEKLSKDPLFLIDGAHNEGGAKALASAIKEAYPNRKFSLIIGILEDKEYEKVLDEMLSFASKVYCVTPPNPRALPKEKLAKVTTKKANNLPIIVCEDIEDALNQSHRIKKEDTIAFGSLYYIGILRNLFFDVDRI